MGYNTINGTIGSIRGKHDSVNSIASGALIGLLFKSTGIYFSTNSLWIFINQLNLKNKSILSMIELI